MMVIVSRFAHQPCDATRRTRDRRATATYIAVFHLDSGTEVRVTAICATNPSTVRLLLVVRLAFRGLTSSLSAPPHYAFQVDNRAAHNETRRQAST